MFSEFTQLHPSKSSTDHRYEATNSKHGDSIVAESPTEHGHFDIIVEPEESLCPQAERVYSPVLLHSVELWGYFWSVVPDNSGNWSSYTNCQVS